MTQQRPITEVAAGILLDAQGRYLLGQRPAGKPYAGYWEVPGGKIEPVVWMRENPKGRVACFTLGHFDEMKHEEIQQVLKSTIDLMLGKSNLK